MPTTYAHYRFGADVLERLPEDRQALIRAHRRLFDFGVHGPDVLFYYKPLSKNAVNQKGYACHERIGRDFFSEAISVAEAAPDREAAVSYLYGVLCHFALDRECHPYVGQKERDGSGASHSLIEASFDGFLMERDGLDPVTHNVTRHLHPSMESARVMAPFYAPITAEEVYQAERSMVFFLKALIAKGPKRAALRAAMKAAGKASLGDLFVPYAQDPRTLDSDLRLFHLYEGAVPLAVELIDQATACLEGAPLETLGPGFDHTFGET